MLELLLYLAPLSAECTNSLKQLGVPVSVIASAPVGAHASEQSKAHLCFSSSSPLPSHPLINSSTHPSPLLTPTLPSCSLFSLLLSFFLPCTLLNSSNCWTIARIALGESLSFNEEERDVWRGESSEGGRVLLGAGARSRRVRQVCRKERSVLLDIAAVVDQRRDGGERRVQIV